MLARWVYNPSVPSVVCILAVVSVGFVIATGVVNVKEAVVVCPNLPLIVSFDGFLAVMHLISTLALPLNSHYWCAGHTGA